ncbi:MAG: putative lipid II flippase FtsW [Candidatus Komeilibacteria bacterium CG_4_9_14_0_8_um_filter_36_9]|uniref:Probable peptidoglycan glycosyltransferase FtsW n=2 Tax=Candidatus Komeiliibacteriota TaxID=1817908 RepID=A0A2M8DQF7_9BACT|nr:MAG: putative lipid II flippase FtsW [Candidatus Komeilibacteria bacterium CG_4_10_14_0_8_um_filter_37_78]PJC01350.1 MAG: putative lipid II flippase FtsW [Candidatus Komeilibacteria bacterium CG_4_9_14_0_8_um_filter_36_9]
MRHKSLISSIVEFVTEPFTGGRNQQAPDIALMILFGAMILFGLLMLSSATTVIAFQVEGDSYFYLKHQLLRGVIPGLILFLIAIRTPYHFWKKMAFWMLVVSVVLLLLVLIPSFGEVHGGAMRWIKVGPISFQPSEIVKITFLIYLATWLEKKGVRGLHDVEYGTIPFLSIIGIIAILFLKQPDLGTLLVILAISFLLYFIAGAPWKYIFTILGASFLILLVLILSSPYRADRLKTFLSGGDLLGEGYHINQAKIAIGSGGIFGLGLGQSQQKYRYLPEVQGDSIFAIMAEEMGFIVSAVFIGLFLVILIKGFNIARGSPDEFGRLLAAGITIWFVIQAVVNLGAMMGLLPLTGITLPLISYGGSSFAISLFAVGILLNISKYSKRRV